MENKYRIFDQILGMLYFFKVDVFGIFACFDCAVECNGDGARRSIPVLVEVGEHLVHGNFKALGHRLHYP